MTKGKLIQALRAYGNRFRNERATVDRFIHFVTSEEDCFERKLTKGHVTGSAWLLNPDRSKVLLTHHKKLGRWLQLGGHADGDSDIFKVALREAQEESGILEIEGEGDGIFDIDIHEIPEGREPAHLHYDVRYLFRAREEAFVVSDESHDLAWVQSDEVSKFRTDSSVLRMFRKWNSVHLDN